LCAFVFIYILTALAGFVKAPYVYDLRVYFVPISHSIGIEFVGNSDYPHAMTKKQKAIEALRSLPDNATFEDAVERLIFLANAENGIEDADAGRTIPPAKLKQLLSAKTGRLSLSQLLKKITKKNRHSEIDWGAPVGREAW